MIRTIDIHTGHTHFDTDVTVIAKNECVVLRLSIGGADVNIFGRIDRLAEIRRAAAVLNDAFAEDEPESRREAAE